MDITKGTTRLVPPWHAAARHASLCAVDLSIGVRSLFSGRKIKIMRNLIHQVKPLILRMGDF